MLPAEVAGCLEAVDDYLASRGLRATQSDAAGTAAPVSAAIARAPNAEAPAAPAAAKPLAAGKDAYQAEHLQAARTCNAQPRAVLSAKGAGFETYTVNCTNGDALTVRCEFGNCRVLR